MHLQQRRPSIHAPTPAPPSTSRLAPVRRPVAGSVERPSDAVQLQQDGLGAAPLLQRKCTSCTKEEVSKERPEEQLGASSEDALVRQAEKLAFVGGVHAAEPSATLHQTARLGVSGAGGPLPHREAIARSFGRYDVSGIVAHTDGAAASANEAMGATAFTRGDHVAFKGPPDLRTAAHEAAHAIQQRSGVHLPGGVGEVGDRYERHADAVADRVVAGESSEATLDEMAGGQRTPTAGPGDHVQHRIPVPRTPDDETATNAQQKINEAKAKLQDPNLDDEERAELQAKIDEAETALQEYRGTLQSGGGMPGALGASTTMNPLTLLVVAVFAVMATILANSATQGPKQKQSGEKLAKALAALGVALMAAVGNVADTGIMNEVNAMIAAGQATDVCDALKKLYDTASGERRNKIKATQKAKGCRGSRQSR
jgi:preprotein translocase subunit SecG